MATISFEIPDLPEGHDEAVLAVVMRRPDPDNGDGSPDPDLAGQFNDPANPFVAALQQQVAAQGFDTSMSFIGIVSLTDAEAGALALIDEVVALGANPPAE